MILLTIVLFCGLFLDVQCGPVVRNVAFDPERLMRHEMDTRTNQNLYGSYHPNDLVQAIVKYFKDGGPQSVSRSDWGLFVYNPNDKIDQYMGNMDSPGDLGPRIAENPYSAQTKHNTEFNPNTLNQQLMQEALSESKQYTSYTEMSSINGNQGQGHAGFTEMASGQTQQQVSNQSKTTYKPDTTPQNILSVATMVGFNPDKLNAGILNSFNASPNVDNNMLDASLAFNPDTVNAGLLGSLKYDPNSPVGHGIQIDNNVATTVTNTGINQFPNQNGAVGLNEHENGASSSILVGSLNAASGSTHQTGTPNNIGNNNNLTGSQFHPGAVGGDGQFNVVQSGVMLTGDGNGNSPLATFRPDVTGNDGNQATTLHQTDTGVPTIHGIGGLG